MSNSNLVSYTKLSPNCSKPRTHAIDTITIHHMAGNLSVETCGNVFAKTSRQASSNYGIGSDGRVGLYVDEANRSWCSGNRANDHRAITIEVANDDAGVKNKTWTVSASAYKALIKLCADICRRNGISKLVWDSNKDNRVNHKNGANMTLHKDFAATGCPGPYLESKMPEIAAEVNKLLNNVTPTVNPAPSNPNVFPDLKPEQPKKYEASFNKSFITKQAQGLRIGPTNTVKAVAIVPKGAKVNCYGYYTPSGSINWYYVTYDGKTGYLSGQYLEDVPVSKSYTVTITANVLNVRKGPGTSYPVSSTVKKGQVYTIVDTQNGWGKLKSGAGWIFLQYTKKN